jgi:hypothetical protein
MPSAAASSSTVSIPPVRVDLTCEHKNTSQSQCDDYVCDLHDLTLRVRRLMHQRFCMRSSFGVDEICTCVPLPGLHV